MILITQSWEERRRNKCCPAPTDDLLLITGGGHAYGRQSSAPTKSEV
ncbi:MAG: hypothetical protein ABH836_04710 [Candidatus Omnitrophota bacterium]